MQEKQSLGLLVVIEFQQSASSLQNAGEVFSGHTHSTAKSWFLRSDLVVIQLQQSRGLFAAMPRRVFAHSDRPTQ